MNKLLFNDNSHSGQTLITILLVMAVSLTVGLAISSRTISTLRQTSYTAQANAAYFAAEAGIEDALQKLKAETITLPYTSSTVRLANEAEYHYKVQSYAGEEFVAIVEQDKVTQVDLSSSALNNKTLTIKWNSPEGSRPAIEYVILKKPVSGDAIMLEKGISDPGDVGRSTISGASSPGPAGEDNYDWAIDTRSLSISDGDKVILRVKPLFVTNVLIKVVCKEVGCVLPDQQVIIRSKGWLGESVRQINVIKSASPALPSIFDFAIYSGSSDQPLNIR